jgi:hypothetical protein
MLFGRYASRAAEARYPQLWAGRVFGLCPSVQGPAGLNVYDLSGRARHSTLTNMDAPTDWVRSAGLYALDFDGTNDYTTTGSFSGQPIVGLQVWLRPTNTITAAASGGVLIQMRSGVSASAWYVALGSATGNLTDEYLTVIDTSAAGSSYRAGITDGGSIASTGWSHVFVRWTGAAYEIWLNGINKTLSTNGTPLLATANTANLACVDGDGGGPRSFYTGMIDDVVQYNRILSPGEIRLLATRRGIAYEARRDVFGQATGSRRLRILCGDYS